MLFLGIALFFIYKFYDLHFSEKINLSTNKEVKIKRGLIKDKNGLILAINIERDSLFANPEEIDNPEEVAKILSPHIRRPKHIIEKRLRKKKRFVWLKRKLNDKIVKRIEDMHIKGLYFKNEFHRIYPHDNLASNIIGFVDIDNRGLEGIEFRFDDHLSGRGKWGSHRHDEDLVVGVNLKLTIDRFIQYIAEREVQNGVEEFDAYRGMAVIIEVKTGRILAIAKYPNYNPNYYYKYSTEVIRNFAVVDSFEPGSTLKIISLAAILEGWPDVLNKKFLCSGKIKIADTTINCTGRHGRVNLKKIIRYSCNVGIIEIMKQINEENLFNVLDHLGFGKRIGIDLPGESNGILRSLDNWSGLSKYSISIGHEISVTILQLAGAFCAIANEGVYIVPRIIESLERDDGSIIKDFYPKKMGNVIKAEVAKKVLKIMRDVIINGTGKKAALQHYNVIGKTGTSQKPMKSGGYYTNKWIASFIGIAPFEDPDICILVVIDEPKNAISGGKVAAPIFANIAKRVLPYRGVKIDPHGHREPQKIQFKERKFDGSTLPDFKGLSISQALKVLVTMKKSHNVKYLFKGNGRIYKQQPVSRTAIKKDQEIILYLR
ncbi:MAG: penicillin-binding transpeptidase domain-containing protein [Spirochaetota bacterium]|nr:penicillin-binding transpeptidase domain-containing protein [Spirochaetota bacterium]